MYKLIILFPVLLLSACAVTDDPSKGGFISGVYGVSSGAYDKRIEERQRNLEALRQAQQGSQAEQQQLQAEKSSLNSQVEQLRKTSADLEQDLDDLSLQISKQKAATLNAQKRKQSLLKKAKYLRGETQKLQKAAANTVNAQSLQKLKAEEQRLQKEIQALQDDLYMGLE